MFSNVIPKKKEVNYSNIYIYVFLFLSKFFQTIKLENDDILADILGEISEVKPKSISNNKPSTSNSSKILNRKNENDLSKQYMQSFSSNTPKSKPITVAKKDGNTSDDELLERIHKKSTTRPTTKSTVTKIITSPLKEKSVLKPKAVENELNIRGNLPQSEPDIADSPPKKNEKDIIDDIPSEMLEPFSPLKETVMDDDDDFTQMDLSVIEEAEAQSNAPKEGSANKTQNKLEELSDKFFLTGWTNACSNIDLNQSVDATTDEIEKIDLSEKCDMKFWYWDAWEDSYVRPGEVCLFGRLLSANKASNDHQSICVHVKNIEKCLFLLPREFVWDTQKKQMTDKPVSLMDVYTEFNEKIAPELGIDTFLSRKATKKYPFSAPEGIDVPEVCEYLEVCLIYMY